MVSLDDFAARGEAAGALIEDARAGRFPHAVLLTGIPGTGKRTLARLLVCALLCQGEGKKPCLTCRACRRVLDGAHPAVLTPACGEGERTVKIDDLREVLRALSRHAGGDGRRAVLLPEAQRMTVQAQNALLKSLEEPQEGTHFFLTAPGDTGLLPTVRSRCRSVRVPPWPEEAVEKALLRRGADGARAQELAALSGGSVGAALDMLDNPAFQKRRELCEKTFFSLKGERSVPAASALLRERREEADELLKLLEQRAREYLLYAMRVSPCPAADENAKSAQDWAHASPRRLEAVLQAVIDAQRYRQANVSWAAIAERLLYRIAEEIEPWQG